MTHLTEHNPTSPHKPIIPSPKYALVLPSLLALAAVYLFQQFDFLHFFTSLFTTDPTNPHPYTTFIFNKTLRFFLNDTLMVVIIWALFQDKAYLRLAIYIELFGLFVLLPVYFTLKLTLEGDSEISSPLLSFIHRLIINPTLLILLIPAIYYQRRTK